MKISTVCVSAGLAAASIGLAGCQNGGVCSVGRPTTAAMSTMEQIKSLEGEWVLVSMNGAAAVEPGTTTFKVSSSGSSVREIMMVGGPHEMTNMYHLNGDEVLMTHYCAAGNQPRLQTVASRPGHVEFQTESVSNLATADTEYMGELTLDMPSPNTLRQSWRSVKEGRKTEGMVIEMRRK